jgi:AcrR family transcriptional regulator
VSPRSADPAVGIRLIEQAARIVADEGRAALTLRRLAADVGVSTMAIYTHFGSMDELWQAVRREGFTRLAVHLEAVEETGDAVADLCVLGWAYYLNATTNPNLYRAMFMERPLEEGDTNVGEETFQHLVHAVARGVASGRFSPADPTELATQVWAASHGVVALQLAGFLEPGEALLCLASSARNLFTAFGDPPAASGRSFARAQPRLVSFSARTG